MQISLTMSKLIDKKKGKQDELRLTSLEPFYRFFQDTRKYLSSNVVEMENDAAGPNKKSQC